MEDNKKIMKAKITIIGEIRKIVCWIVIFLGLTFVYIGIRILFVFFNIFTNSVSLLELINIMPINQRLWFWLGLCYVMARFCSVSINYGIKWIKWGILKYDRRRK